MLQRLINECEEFYKSEVTNKTAKEVYNDYYKIYFYEQLGSFFEYYEINKEDEKDIYNNICKLVENETIKSLYESYMDYDEAISLTTWFDIEDYLYKNKKDKEQNN